MGNCSNKDQTRLPQPHHAEPRTASSPAPSLTGPGGRTTTRSAMRQPHIPLIPSPGERSSVLPMVCFRADLPVSPSPSAMPGNKSFTYPESPWMMGHRNNTSMFGGESVADSNYDALPATVPTTQRMAMREQLMSNDTTAVERCSLASASGGSARDAAAQLQSGDVLVCSGGGGAPRTDVDCSLVRELLEQGMGSAERTGASLRSRQQTDLGLTHTLSSSNIENVRSWLGSLDGESLASCEPEESASSEPGAA